VLRVVDRRVPALVLEAGAPVPYLADREPVRRPELRHVRIRVKSPGQNGSRERGFGTLKYERLFLDEIADALTLLERAEDYRIEHNQIRPLAPIHR
jgi:hypothetical protein